jgi:hypothetical protein
VLLDVVLLLIVTAPENVALVNVLAFPTFIPPLTPIPPDTTSAPDDVLVLDELFAIVIIPAKLLAPPT